jgi:hypothetical protein
VGGEQHHAGGGEAENTVDARHPEAVLAAELQWPSEPPGVEQQGDPGDRAGDEEPATEGQDPLVGEQREQPAA